MLNDYANQSITRQTMSSINAYNEPTYSSTTIKGRKEPTNKLVRNAQGEEITSNSFVITESLVLVNDLLDGSQVLTVDILPDIDGTTQFYEAYLA